MTDIGGSASLVGSADGTVLWRRTGADEILQTADAVYFATYGGQLSKIDLVSGEVLWRQRFGRRLARELVAEADVALLSKWDRLIAIDPSSGERKWRYDPDPGRAVGSIIGLGEDRVAIVEVPTRARGATVGRETILVLDQTDGTVVWTQPHAEHGSSVIVGDLLLTRADGGHAAFDLDTGAPLWSWPGVRRGLRWAVATDDRILLPFAETHNARLLMVDAGSGELQWAASAEGSLSSPPLVTDRLVILGLAQRDPDADVAEQPGAVVAFERTTGRALWSVTTPDPVLTTPIAVGDSLYVMSADELVGCH